MKKILMLLIVPVFYLLFFSLVRYAEGPLYYNMLYDPSYVYLISSLNLAQGIGVFHTDHPGSTVQILGAVIVKCLHLAFGKTADISQSVFITPESYVNAIYVVLIILNSVGMFYMGRIIFKTVNSISIAFLFQLTPLVCFPAFRRLTQVSSEVYLVFVIVILIAFFIKFIYEKEIPPKKLNYYMIIFGILCGLAIVTKLSSVTLLIIPFFLLTGIFRKIIFLIVTILTFAVIIYPVAGYLRFFIDYAYNTLVKSGGYGQGESNIIKISVYLTNLKNIFTGEILLSIILILILAATIIAFFKKDLSGDSVIRKERKLLLLIFLSIIANIAMVSKNFWSHYLLVVEMLLIPSLYLMVSLFRGYPYIRKNFYTVFILLCSLASVLIIYKSIIFYKEESFNRAECEKLEIFMRKNSNNTLGIYTFGISNVDLALAFSTLYAGRTGKEYFSEITNGRTEFLYYDVWKKSLRNWWNPANVDDIEKIKQKLLSGKRILYVKRGGIAPVDSDEPLINILKVQYGLNVRLKQVFSNKNYETAYEIILEK